MNTDRAKNDNGLLVIEFKILFSDENKLPIIKQLQQFHLNKVLGSPHPLI